MRDREEGSRSHDRSAFKSQDVRGGGAREGCARPPPPAGTGVGETRFPHIPACGLHHPELSRGRGCGETRFPHTPACRRSPPTPARGHGRGGNPVSSHPCVRAQSVHPRPRARAWGNPVFPHPCVRAAPSRTLPWAGAWGNPVSPHPCGRAQPAHPRPRARAWGNPVSPSPCGAEAGTRLLPPTGGGWEGGYTQRTMVISAVHAAPPHHAAMKIRLFLGGLRPPTPSRGWGNGETRFPHSPAPAAYVHVRRSCAWRTTPNEHAPGARASRPHHGSAGTVTAPSLTLRRWGREPGSSPQRGEAGRGAEPCARWSPQTQPRKEGSGAVQWERPARSRSW